MKKICLTIGVILITISSIFSQDKKINYGISIGTNYSSLIKSDNEITTNYKGNIGFLIGGFMNINFTNKISLKPELIFSLQRNYFSIDPNQVFTNGEDPNSILFSIIQGQIIESMIIFPITANIHFNDKVNMQIGPQLGYNIQRKIEYKTEFEGDFFKLGGGPKKLELGAILDFGYNLSNKLRIGIRYAYGITKRQRVNTSVFSIAMQYKI